jgi:hypothetical protein
MAAPKPRWGGAPSDFCKGCAKRVYPAEKLQSTWPLCLFHLSRSDLTNLTLTCRCVVEGQIWHGDCLRCKECSKKITGANWGGFVPPDNTAYCRVYVATCPPPSLRVY